MASVMSLCLLASMKSSSLSSMRNSVVSAHKWAPAEWPMNTMLSYKRQKTRQQEDWVNVDVHRMMSKYISQAEYLKTKVNKYSPTKLKSFKLLIN